MKYSSCREINDEAKRLVANGWEFTRGAKHGKLRAPTGQTHGVPAVAGCQRAAVNWIHQVRRIERSITTTKANP